MSEPLYRDRPLVAWALHPAHWWQFWLPQSGFIGGCIFGLTVGTLLFGLFLLYRYLA